jgi:hypothetical protein
MTIQLNDAEREAIGNQLAHAIASARTGDEVLSLAKAARTLGHTAALTSLRSTAMTALEGKNILVGAVELLCYVQALEITDQDLP